MILRSFILIAIVCFFGCSRSESELSVPYTFAASVKLDGSPYEIRYRVDGESYSSIYVYLSSEETASWYIQYDPGLDSYYLNELSECTGNDIISLFLVDENGDCQTVVDSLPAETEKQLSQRGNILSYVLQELRSHFEK